ncbi:TetR family transcriptional regulator [Haloactinopolyspora alba]|uniref:TetR family transcriptional regulator n=2 Tax=Haloactinopolyspora alba TaxID=648780 RepID=A0A2P8EFU4_9ACTN|nr:TetR family transcriptional regulator [Haloactinopolyspora alba]
MGARHTRSAIVARGLDVASMEGLGGLTIGRLAHDLAISKSGLLGHFGSKQSLQLAVLDAAADVFRHEVWDRVADQPAGLPRLRATCEAWVSYLERRVFPGGCFFTAVTSEFDDRHGPVRDGVARLARRWNRSLRADAERAAADLPAGTDPDQLVYELSSLMLGLNYALQMWDDECAPERTRRAVHRLLGPPAAT